MTYWWGVGRPLFERTADISNYSRVGVTQEERRWPWVGFDFYTVYVVSVLGHENEAAALIDGCAEPVPVYESSSSGSAVKVAEDVADVLGVPLAGLRSG